MQERSHGVAEPPYDCLYMYSTFQAVLFLCELSDYHCDDTYDTVDSLQTPTGAVLLIIRGQTVSSPATSSHKTVVRNSACRVNSYLGTYLST